MRSVRLRQLVICARRDYPSVASPTRFSQLLVKKFGGTTHPTCILRVSDKVSDKKPRCRRKSFISNSSDKSVSFPPPPLTSPLREIAKGFFHWVYVDRGM